MLAHVDNRITYSGNGNATEFAYQFKILDRTDIKVLLTDADGKEKLLTKDYYVDVEKNVVRYPGYAVGAEVPESERPPVLPAGWKLTIYREVPVTQETDLPDQYPFNQVEDIGDKLTMIAQQLTDVTSRSLKISVNKSADIDTTIPFDAGKSFRIADDGKSIVLTEDPARVLPLAQGVYAQAQAQAQSAYASAVAAAQSEDSAAASASEATAKAAEATDGANRAKSEADRAKSISDSIGNPVSDVTENNGTVTVTKSNGTQSTFMAFPQDANGTLPIEKGGTGATSAISALSNLGILDAIVNASVSGKTITFTKKDNTKFSIDTQDTNNGIVAALLEQNGYVKFSNGLILQWGTDTAASSSSGVTISYPLAFSSAVYSVAIVPEGGNQTSKWGVSSITTSNFKYYRSDGSPTASRWIAVGK